MSNVPIFLDTGALIALISNNKSEKERFEKIDSFLKKKPHNPRFITQPCLVELFYKICQKGKIKPSVVGINLSHYDIELFSVSSSIEQMILESYYKVGQANSFDYADYFLCHSALRFPISDILTIDSRDLPIAYARAHEETLQKTNFANFHPLDVEF